MTNATAARTIISKRQSPISNDRMFGLGLRNVHH